MRSRSPEEGAAAAVSGGRLVSAIRADLAGLRDREKAATLRRFFKTGAGEYGEGDRFLGVAVPQIRRLARIHGEVPISTAMALLKSRIHEERLLALLILVRRFSRGSEGERERIYNLYLRQTKWVNNWDLVDLTAPKIVGEFLLNRDKAVLFTLARSRDLWERRISIVATAAFIRRGEYSHTLGIAEVLLDDNEDLIHKAAGWMLREVGKRDLPTEEKFLRRHCQNMPRTMLRYAIERFPERKRQRYLKGKIRAEGNR